MYNEIFHCCLATGPVIRLSTVGSQVVLNSCMKH